MKSKWPQYYKSTEKSEAKANSLRKNETEAEKLLWKILRNRKALGLKFRRQHPIGPFIVDFYCHEVKLVIELDGEVHSIDFVKKHDNTRQQYLEKEELIILRFQNELVFSNPDSIIEQIKSVIK
jgi:very-short-patch-repair endonuclease